MAQNELFLRLTKCKANKEGSKTKKQDAIDALRNLNIQNTQDLIRTTTLRANIQNAQTKMQVSGLGQVKIIPVLIKGLLFLEINIILVFQIQVIH